MNFKKQTSAFSFKLFSSVFLVASFFVFVNPNLASAQVGNSCSVDSQCGSSSLFCYNDACATKTGASFSDYVECWSALMGKVESPKTVCCQTFSNDQDCKSPSSVNNPAGTASGLTSQQILNGFNECVDVRFADVTEKEAIISCCVQWPNATICQSPKVDNPIVEIKSCSPDCEAGYSCNIINGVCVKNASNPGTDPGSSNPGNQNPGTNPGTTGAVCKQGMCPTGLCEVNGLCLPKSNFNTGIAASDSLVDLLTKVIKFLLTFAGIIAVGVLVIGGFWYITSAGNEEQAEKGQKAITNAIIGLVVVVLAYTIVAIISSTLVADKFVK